MPPIWRASGYTDSVCNAGVRRAPLHSASTAPIITDRIVAVEGRAMTSMTNESSSLTRASLIGPRSSLRSGLLSHLEDHRCWWLIVVALFGLKLFRRRPAVSRSMPLISRISGDYSAGWPSRCQWIASLAPSVQAQRCLLPSWPVRVVSLQIMNLAHRPLLVVGQHLSAPRSPCLVKKNRLIIEPSTPSVRSSGWMPGLPLGSDRQQRPPVSDGLFAVASTPLSAQCAGWSTRRGPAPPLGPRATTGSKRPGTKGRT